MRCTLATAGPLSPFSSVGRAIGGAGGLVLLPLFAIHPLLPGGLPGLHRTQKKNRKKKNGKIQKNKVFVLCGIVGKRAFIAPVISVVGA
jgi:hypothetical protein